jgi:glycosyltransferase involved in cell wall biosynthesis
MRYTRDMRIAFITHKFVVPSETFVRDLALGLVEAGHEVVIVCDSLNAEGRQCPGLRFHSCGFRAIKRAAKASGFLGELLARISHGYATLVLRRVLARIKPDVVYGEFGTNAADAVDAVKALGLPLVVSFHGFDATAAMRKPLYKKYIERVMAYTHAATVPSAHIKRLLVIGGADGKKICVTPCGISPGRCEAPDWNAKLKSPPTVISVGRFVAKKNPVALIEAYRIVHEQMPEARFVMIGAGKLEGEVRERIRRHGLENCVEMTGALPHEQVLRRMADAWIFAQNSATSIDGDQEGMPVSVQEAMACGLPVVATLHSGIPDAVTDGVHGYLAIENDYDTIAERLLRLLRNPALARELGAAGREKALRHFDNAAHVEKVDALLREAMNEASSQR